MTFGTDLKDNIPTIIDYIGDGIQSLNQLRSFLKEKSSIEREYAQKLENLTKKYRSQNKKSLEGQHSSTDEWEWEDSGSTCVSAWLQLLNQTSLLAKSRFRLSDDLNSLIVEGLRGVSTRKEDARKKHAAFFQKIKSERDKTFANKDKAKQTYDESCQEIENIKAKLSKSSGDQEKHQRHLDAAVLDCDNKKNLYLLSIAVANAEGSKYVEEDTPSLADHLEDLESSRIIALKTLLTNYISLESKSISTAQEYHDDSLKVIQKIDPSIDAGVFTRKALSKSSTREDFVQFSFVPWNGGANAAETIIDRDDSLVISDSAVIFLNNKLVKDRKKLDVLGDDLSTKSGQLDTLKQTVAAIENKASSDYDKSTEKLMNVYRDITVLSTQKVRVKSEVDLIIHSIGDDGLRAQSHDFKPSSFTIPTTCDFCSSTIWGLSNKGLTCKACGFNCHARCEMKVAQNCSGKKGQINPQPAPSTLHLSSASMRRKSSSINDSPITPTGYQESSTSLTSQQKADMRSIYSYDAQNADELTINEGDVLSIVEPDDGSGWIKAQLGDQVGLVPANYIEYLNENEPNVEQETVPEPEIVPEPQPQQLQVQEPEIQVTNSDIPPPPPPPPPPPSDTNNVTETVVALYDFEAVHPEELNLHEGDVIIVTKKDDSGWWEGTLNGQFGIFPSNYVSNA